MNYSKSILLIDDDDISNFLVSRLLNSLENSIPYHIIANSEDGLNYLKTLDNSSKVLILLEIHMPVLDGFEFIEHLKTNSEIDKSLFKVVIISSSAFQRDLNKAKQLGIEMVLLKPIKKECLQSIINNF